MPNKGLLIIAGPAKGKGEDIGSPDSLDAAPAPKGRMAAHEEAETPEYEQSEEYGAKLVQDIEAAGKRHGLDPEKSRMAFADMMRAAANCLSGGGEQEAEGEQESGGEEASGPDGYEMER